MNKPISLVLAVLFAASTLYATVSTAAAATVTATQTPVSRATKTAAAPKPASTATGTVRRTPAPSATKVANRTATKVTNQSATKAVGRTATKIPKKTATRSANRTATKAPNLTATKAPIKAAPQGLTATVTKVATRVQTKATAAAATPVPAASPVAPAITPTRTALRPTAVATRLPAPTQTAAPTAVPVPTAVPPAAAGAPAGDAPQLNLRSAGTVPGYDRATWKHWVDADGDCQDTRAEVLIAESLEPVTFTSSANCTVLGGRWYDPYTGAFFSVAGDLDVDHFIPLSNAHSSGGAAWARDRKRDFANSLNDADHLIAVSASANRSKGNRAPDEWKPPNQGYWCEYAYDWIRVKSAWGLSATAGEWAALSSMTATCPAGFTYGSAAGAPASVPAPATAVAVVPATAQPPATAVIVVVPTEVLVVATAVVATTDVPVAATAVVAPTDAPTAAPAATAVAAGQCAPGQIDVNSASLEDLQRISHIGASRAQALVALRPFSSVSDLARISGIGNGARLAQIKAENLACVN